MCVCVYLSKGYDSDVAWEKTVDYTSKMYAVSIREMRGTKPHQQLKEMTAEERYAPAHTRMPTAIHTHTHTLSSRHRVF